ncbi:response regulator [Candidatus Poribacteria bacterium]|nr:response regulator [Candidatus Poribacteria bacterium]
MMRMTLSRTLRSGGYRVVETGNGRQALDVLWNGPSSVQVQNKTQMVNVGGKAQMVNMGGEESIDLAIIDITMIEMDGLELVQRIRSNTKTADLPVLICTISRKKDHIIRAAQLGVKGFLVKPISPKLVLAKVDKILNG